MERFEIPWRPNMLVKHLRDLNRTPFATLVAIKDADGNISTGCAICSEHDHFNKKRGVEIAAGRAMVGNNIENGWITGYRALGHEEKDGVLYTYGRYNVPNGFIEVEPHVKNTISYLVEQEAVKLRERARKYFRVEVTNQ